MKHSVISISIISSVVFLSMSAAYSEEITYRTHIQPLFERQCAQCHDTNAAPEYRLFRENAQKWTERGVGMRMNTYSHLIAFTGWPYTGALMRRLDDGSSSTHGRPGNMYENLGATDKERQQNLAIFKQWVGNWSLKRWADSSKEDISAIRVPY